MCLRDNFYSVSSSVGLCVSCGLCDAGPAPRWLGHLAARGQPENSTAWLYARNQKLRTAVWPWGCTPMWTTFIVDVFLARPTLIPRLARAGWRHMGRAL